MARADLIVKLVKSGNSGDKELFKKVVQALIAEERNKQHHVLANELEDILQLDSNGYKSSLVSKYPSNLFDDKIQNILYNVYPKVSLNDLILEDYISRSINEFINEHNRTDLLRSYGLEPRNRILLKGDPGNGKTSLAESVATSLMIPFYVIRYEGIIGSYLGETASRLNKMFDFISTQNCVLFFDEFDAIGKERGDIHETGEIKRVVNSLLLQIDRLPNYVIIIAATNHPELLDRAVWRRFQIKLELKRPDVKKIELYLMKFENQFQKSLGIKSSLIASKLLGLSFSEISDFISDIKRKYVLSLPEANMKRIVTESLENYVSK